MPAGDPSWLPGILPTQYTSMNLSSGSSQTITAGSLNTTPATSKKIKTTGDMTFSGGSILTLAPYVDPNTNLPVDSYFEIWVTGQLTLSGGSQIAQQAHVHVTFYVDNKITMSGGSFNNANAKASYLTINGNWTPSNPNSYSPLAATFSGGSGFYGLVNAPYYAITVSGGSSFHGSFIGDSLTASGGGTKLWSDSSLNTGVSANGNYAYASWFEDNSDPQRGVVY
jgi:hypothetical protein